MKLQGALGGKDNSVFAKFEEISKLQLELENKIANIGQNAFIEAFAAFFERYPEIDGIAWRQYTPYFNDGDPCIFSVNDIYFISKSIVQKYPDVSVETYLDTYAIYPYTLPKEIRKINEDMCNISKQIPTEIFLKVFGDHATIKIDRDGRIIVDECQHD